MKKSLIVILCASLATAMNTAVLFGLYSTLDSSQAEGFLFRLIVVLEFFGAYVFIKSRVS